MMNELKVGDWLIGPPLNVPTKIKELKSTTQFIGRILGQDEDLLFDFDKDDRVATAREIGDYFLEMFKEITPEEILDRIYDLNDEEMNMFFDSDTDTFYLNGFIIFEDGEFVPVR